MSEYLSQSGIRSRAFSTDSKIKTDFSGDNLFTGVWHLNQDNLDRFDPFIQGWAAIVWTKLPAFFEKCSKKDFSTQFKTLTERNFKAFSGIGDLTLDADQVSGGFNGNELPVATNIKKENTTFTIKHTELSGSPVRELYSYWVTGIRDPETGIATYHGAIASGEMVYTMANHTGELLYTVTDPSFAIGGANGIEFAAYYTNVFPTKLPQDHLNYSSGDHGLTEIDQEFRGCFHVGKDVNELAIDVMKHYTISKSYGEYEISKKNVLSYKDGYGNT